MPHSSRNKREGGQVSTLRVHDGEAHPRSGGSKDTINVVSRKNTSVVNHNKGSEEVAAPRSKDAISSDYHISGSQRSKK